MDVGECDGVSCSAVSSCGGPFYGAVVGDTSVGWRVAGASVSVVSCSAVVGGVVSRGVTVLLLVFVCEPPIVVSLWTSLHIMQTGTPFQVVLATWWFGVVAACQGLLGALLYRACFPRRGE